MKQFNWKYYFVLLLFVPVLLKVFLEAENHITFLWTFVLLMGYLAWILFSGIIFYKYNKGRRLRNGFCINYEYEMLAMHFWIDIINKQLAVLCLLNPFKVQYFHLDSIEKIEPVVSYAGRKKNYAYSVYFYITINGKKTSVGVASPGRGCLININYVNFYLEYIQNFKEVIWKAKLM